MAERTRANGASQPDIEQPQTNKIPTVEKLRAQFAELDARLSRLEAAVNETRCS